MFRSDVSQREEVARQREFSAMMELKHDNIVRFIAVEQEVHSYVVFLRRVVAHVA